MASRSNRFFAFTIFLLLFVVVTSTCGMESAALAAEKTAPPSVATGDKVLTLDYSSAPIGKLKVFAQPSGLRIQFFGSAAYIVARAPSWDVALYNPKTKLGMRMTYSDWLGHSPQWAYLPDDWPGKAAILKIGSGTALKQPCTIYVLALPGPDGKLVNRGKDHCDTYFVAKDIIGSRQACRILQRAFNVPQTDGLPVSMAIWKSARTNGASDKISGMKLYLGGLSHHLTLNSIGHERMLNDGFAYPGKFKSVRKEAEVLTDPNRVKDFEDVLR